MVLKNKFDILFEFFGSWLYMAVDILFSISYVLTKLRLFPWFSLLFYAGNRKKSECAVLGYKEGLKIKSDILFEFFGPWLYMTFDIFFSIFYVLTKLRLFLWFSLLFYAENRKKHENAVLGYKKWSKFKFIIGFEKFDPNLYMSSTLKIYSFHTPSDILGGPTCQGFL